MTNSNHRRVTQATAFLFCLVPLLFTDAATAAERDPTRVLPAGELPADSRLDKPKDLNGYFPFSPPATLDAWKARRERLRTQVLVATGLWPMPDKLPLRPVVHGRLDRGDYTIEKVYFATLPGFYLCGNLYRPKNKPGKRPAVLAPHGHAPQGRFTELDDQQVATKSEEIGTDNSGSRAGR